MNKINIIAEVGVNHNGRIDLAREMVKRAKDSGADMVKFQTFRPEALVSRRAIKADYQKRTTGNQESQLDMIRNLSLNEEAHRELLKECSRNGISFLSSPFDMESIDFLTTLGVQVLKIPSGEITNLPYLRAIGSRRLSLLLSTGMCDLGEVEDAIAVLIEAGTARSNIALLHCNTEYPTPYADVNLRAMETLRRAFQTEVGYSDHTEGIEVAVAAVALGATVIEKHFTLDRNQPGPDHAASLEPDEFAKMVRAIRNVELSLGSGIKACSASERRNLIVARKSIVAARPIRKGQTLRAADLTTKRPGDGISPMEWDRVAGTTSTRDYNTDELIEL